MQSWFLPILVWHLNPCFYDFEFFIFKVLFGLFDFHFFSDINAFSYTLKLLGRFNWPLHSDVINAKEILFIFEVKNWTLSPKKGETIIWRFSTFIVNWEIIFLQGTELEKYACFILSFRFLERFSLLWKFCRLRRRYSPTAMHWIK